MSITFYPDPSDSDIKGYAGECHADYTKAPVTIGFAATYEESCEIVKVHMLTCDECRGYGALVDIFTDTPSVNMSNTNGQYIGSLLGIDMASLDYCGIGSMPASELLERIAFASVVADNTATDTVAYQTEGGATMVDCGRRAGYADERLSQLREIAEWAAAHGREVQWS